MRAPRKVREENLRLARNAVILAAQAYIREVDNPAPDLLYRAQLRDELRAAVGHLDLEATK